VRREDSPGYSGVARRSIFIVDHDGIIRWTWVTSPEQRLPDYDQVLEQAKLIAAGAPD
jgi:peroxiredoxin